MRKREHHIKVWNEHNPNDVKKQHDGFVIHHRDGNHFNNDPYNLQKVTREEHASIHHKDKPKSDEWKRKVSISQTGKVRSDNTKRKISQSHIGNIQPERVRNKISLALKIFCRNNKDKIKQARRGGWITRRLNGTVFTEKQNRQNSERVKAYFTVLENRKKTSEATKKAMNTPEMKAKMKLAYQKRSENRRNR